MELINSLELDLLGTIEEFNEVDCEKISNKLEILYSRMNLPQFEEN